jgi:hypothetical protein
MNEFFKKLIVFFKRTSNTQKKLKMSSQLQFTRYLYAKDEVEVSFLTSLLKKNDRALFWAYELFYSGYDLSSLFWKVYYDFYATINPAFEKYLATKMKQALNEQAVCAIVKNFIIRRYNTDVFMVRTVVKQFDIERDPNKGIVELLITKDFMEIGSFILEYVQDSDLAENYKCALEYFVKQDIRIDTIKALTDFKKNPLRRTMFLSKMIHYFSVLGQVKMGRNLYIQIEDGQTNVYKTIEEQLGRSYKVLPIARTYNIDDDNYLSLFKLSRETTDATEALRDNWLFHASFSPLWKERIESHGGCVTKNKVTFENEDSEEQFNEHFNLEPDEQKLEVQEKSTEKIKHERDWLSFYKEHKYEGVVDVDQELLTQIQKITY